MKIQARSLFLALGLGLVTAAIFTEITPRARENHHRPGGNVPDQSVLKDAGPVTPASVAPTNTPAIPLAPPASAGK